MFLFCLAHINSAKFNWCKEFPFDRAFQTEAQKEKQEGKEERGSGPSSLLF
jgi:hypothetical protein